MLAATLLLAIGACGGGSGGGSGSFTPSGCSSSSCGDVYLGLTDADGDFLTYTVDVQSLTLKKANGALVETVPAVSRVDFAQLVDLTEFLTARSVPNGDYVEGSIRLDYGNADIQVDVGGVATPAHVVDDAGNAVGVVDLAIKLDNRNHLIVAPGRPRFIELDFDLDASNTVGDLTQSPVPVTLRPFIVASVEPAETKQIRVRGPLVDVDTIASTYQVDIRPFHRTSGDFGRVTVHTDDQTLWEVDGIPLLGAAGLAALAAEPAGTPTAAFGTLSRPDRTFTAARVNVGTSVESAQFDAISGNVTARSGDTLTVRGVTLDRRDGSVKFMRGDATLLLGNSTKVTAEGNAGMLTIGAISVGQHIRAFGTVTSESTTGDVTIDATAGRVRLRITNLIGLVQGASTGNLTMNVQAFDGHRPAIFDFTGTGTSAANDADPTHYEIATGNLDLNLFTPGSPARVFGFVTPFGMAPPDFTGRTLVDFHDVPSVLGVGWRPEGTAAPFTTMSTSGLTIDAANPDLGARHHIVLAFHAVDITTLGIPVTLVPDAASPGTFAIAQPRQVEIFGSFDDFVGALTTELTTANAVGLNATGHFDASTGNYSTHRVLITLKPNN
ncbi:MAG: DUF4382 domain-containing protein [Steroidobacteraceae bacterium]